MKGLNERQREAFRIFYHKHNGESYLDARVYAADEWFHASLMVNKWLAGETEVEKVQARQNARYDARTKKEDRYARERAELKARADQFINRMNEREEKLYGPHKHDLPAQIEALKDLKGDRFGYIPGTYQKMGYEEQVARRVLYEASVMLVCEPVLWGECLPETREAQAAVQAVIQKIEEEREQERREAEGAEARRKAEAEEERERRMREQAQHPPPSRSTIRPPDADRQVSGFMREILSSPAFEYYREVNGIKLDPTG